MSEQTKSDQEKFPPKQPFIVISGDVLGQGRPRTRIVAALLGILGGGVGLHKFYLGQMTWGIAYVVFCWTFIPVILGLVEGIYLLAMDDEVFLKRHSGPAWST